jgi:AcrR family transcriptional regulator
MMSDHTAVRGREKKPSLREVHKEMTRQRLIDAAVEVFEEKGYTSSTVEDITTRANVSRTTFYLHFATKREVAIANGDQLLARIPRHYALLTASPGVDLAVAGSFLDALVEMLHDQAQQNIVAYEANVADAELTAKGWRDFLGLGQDLLDDFLAHGWLPVDDDAATHLAIMLPSIQYALWGQGIFRIDAPNEVFMRSLAVLVVDAVARSVRRP